METQKRYPILIWLLFIEGVRDADSKEVFNSCNHFLVDSELENGGHSVFNFAMSYFNEKLDHVFNQLKCVAKVNLAIKLVLKNTKDGTCRFFYAHENNTVMEKSKLLCTKDDKRNLTQRLQKLDNIDNCTRKRANTRKKFYQLSNVTVSAVLLKDKPIGCEDT